MAVAIATSPTNSHPRCIIAPTYQVNRTREMDCLGSVVDKVMAPSFTSRHFGDSNSCSPADAFSCSYCSDVGDCGDPIAFHTVYALLCVSSMR